MFIGKTMSRRQIMVLSVLVVILLSSVAAYLLIIFSRTSGDTSYVAHEMCNSFCNGQQSSTNYDANPSLAGFDCYCYSAIGETIARTSFTVEQVEEFRQSLSDEQMQQVRQLNK